MTDDLTMMEPGVEPCLKSTTIFQEEDHEFVKVGSSKKQRLAKQVEVANKQSSRVSGTRTPIPLRAEMRAAMFHSQGTSSNPFTVLQDISPEILSKLALDSGVVLRNSKEEVDVSIDLIKAKELAQATLAEAEKNKEVLKPAEVVLEVEDFEENFNEEHSRVIQDLEEVVDDSTITEEIEVVLMGTKGKTKVKPKLVLSPRTLGG